MPLLLGSAPNQVPTNGDLGTAAFVDIAPLADLILNAPQTLTNKTLVNIVGSIDLNTATAIASASSINLDNILGNRVHITGTTAITSIVLSKGPRTVIFDGILILTHNATTNNLPGAANITTAAGDRAVYEGDGTTVYCVSYVKASGATVVDTSTNGAFRSLQVFTSSGTYTRPAGLVRAKITVVGGGGGGGSANPAGGGGGGGAAIKVVNSATIGSSQTITIGAGGALGSAGGTSSVGSLVSATGGDVGSGPQPGNGGLGISGDLNMAGGVGQPGDTAYSRPGDGGSSVFGGGGKAVGNFSGGSYGGGGPGQVSGASSPSGASGVIFIEEFF
jgi:hypothetical protein